MTAFRTASSSQSTRTTNGPTESATPARRAEKGCPVRVTLLDVFEEFEGIKDESWDDPP
ncbi:hypothetical protein ACFQPA_15850 [Halomarina halobia]|uniref:Uncharacterized protein n=1 Tax=Halomarina halobia TaxID=3033386 RepID=A0ABD6AGB9_9EURY|nr:hypothetical protein [Halomarina sp. PSR21]